MSSYSGQFLETSWEFFDEGPHYSYHDPSHTRGRPPHLNERNFASAQAGRYSAESMNTPSALRPISLRPKNAYAISNDTPSAGSEVTDITLKISNAVAKEASRPTTPVPVIADNVNYWATRNYDGSAQPLTKSAMKALEYETSTTRQTDSIPGWLQGQSYSYQKPKFADVSVSAKRSYRAGSQMTYATGFSWTMVSSQSHFDHTDENVCAAGYQFDDVSYPPHSQALDIDEDTRDNL
jgi:hypothetical protein